MRLPIYQVDAFTDTLFTGNPAAVCPLEAAVCTFVGVEQRANLAVCHVVSHIGSKRR